MKHTYTLYKTLVILLCLNSSTQLVAQNSLVAYVKPRIGTAHCRSFHFAPGALPFGMAKPGPSTNGHLGNASGWEATGYDYRELSIEGFPCLHEFQIGGIVLMPTVGALVMPIMGLLSDNFGQVAGISVLFLCLVFIYLSAFKMKK